MVTAKEVDRQLKKIGVSFWFFGNAERRELRHILVEEETIEHCVLGRYEGGFALLCATNLRLLLVDKKPFYLTVEDVRYDMIVEVDFSHRLIDAGINVCTPNKTLRFTGWKKPELRQMTNYIQHRVIEFRQQHLMQPAVASPSYSQPQQQQAWQPQRFIEQTGIAAEHPGMKTITRLVAQTALDGASRVTEVKPIQALRQAVNPYARSSLLMRQRISRF